MDLYGLTAAAIPEEGEKKHDPRLFSLLNDKTMARMQFFDQWFFLKKREVMHFQTLKAASI